LKKRLGNTPIKKEDEEPKRYITYKPKYEEKPQEDDNQIDDNWGSLKKSINQMKGKLEEYKNERLKDRSQVIMRKENNESFGKPRHRREKTERMEREEQYSYRPSEDDIASHKNNIENADNNDSLGKLVSWEKSQRILKQCKKVSVTPNRPAKSVRLNKRGKSINSRCCQNCMNLLHRGLSTRDCTHHYNKSPFKK